MKSAVLKRSIELHGHKTSVSLEDGFWNGLREIAAATNTSLQDLLRNIDSARDSANLSSAIRVFVFTYYRDRQAPELPNVDLPAHAQSSPPVLQC
ncbi:MAG TPA: ribbon-helix-helix domain-containing protein [Pseudolabrys sp.]|nr:ribbon-helix-helix domain-containing protein [Pseudolabrys sp.]